MAKIPGTNVASPIAPFTTDDQFPTHDAIYGKGGQREVATIAERDAIPSARLTEGCTCYVAATEKTYRWKSNAWVDDTPEIPDSVTSVIANHELVFQTPDGQSVKGKVGITTGADGLLHLTLTDEEGNTYSSPIAGLRVDGNALQYSNDGQTWTTVQTFGNLTIKYVQASDPASGDEGDLALVGTTNAYVLKVYVGGSWVSVCDFGTLDLTSDGITIVGESKTLTQKMAEVNEVLFSEGSNIIDISNMAAEVSETYYLTPEKDAENNGVQFSVRHQYTAAPLWCLISTLNLQEGKKYRLSFEYKNTAFESKMMLRDSSNNYISSFPSSTLSVNSDYTSFQREFVAPSDVKYLAFSNVAKGADNSYLSIKNLRCVEVLTISEDVVRLENDVAQISEDIDNINDIKSSEIDIPVINDGFFISTLDGTVTESSNGCHSDYLPTCGASRICVYAPPLNSQSFGIAFYGRRAATTWIEPDTPSDYIFSHQGEWKWITYDVPEGATMFRMSLRLNTGSKYRLVTPLSDLQNLYIRSVEDGLYTQIFRQAKMLSDKITSIDVQTGTPVISEKNYLYAFAIYQMSIVDGKAYVEYYANELEKDADEAQFMLPGAEHHSDICRSIVDLRDMSHTTILPTNDSIKFFDGTDVEPVSSVGIGINYVTQCPTPNGQIAYFGLMRRNDFNPYYCSAIENAGATGSNWKTCKLSYGGVTVDFTPAYYRQMLYDMGYMATLKPYEQERDTCDNVNLHYDKEHGLYYAVLCGGRDYFPSLPLVLMTSTDMRTWSPSCNLGESYGANEIAAIFKGGIAYIIWRIPKIKDRQQANESKNFIQWKIYDVVNETTLGEGEFPGTFEIASKPDCFVFHDDVYMAMNVDPSVFGEARYTGSYTVNARSEIAIYKIVGNKPVLFRRVNNPTGINYFSFMEINPIVAKDQTNPISAQNSIYCAFSEDRRHIYSRQIAQVSFADVTALFANAERIF